MLQQVDELGEVGETGLVELAAVVEQVDIGGVVTGKTGVQILAENVVAGGPVQVDGLGVVADNSGQAQLFLHRVDLGKGLFIRGGAGQRGGINAGLLQNVGIVGKADGLGGVGEADNAILVDVSGVSVGNPGFAAHVDQQAVPVGEVGVTAVDKDVRHVVALIEALQRALNINAAAHGLDVDLHAGLFLISRGELFEHGVDLDLAVDKADLGAGGGRADAHQSKDHDESQHECENLFHCSSFLSL